MSDDYRYAFAINEGDGRVTVNTTLDASQYNYYEYTLVATVCVLPDNYKIIMKKKSFISVTRVFFKVSGFAHISVCN